MTGAFNSPGQRAKMSRSIPQRGVSQPIPSADQLDNRPFRGRQSGGNDLESSAFSLLLRRSVRGDDSRVEPTGPLPLPIIGALPKIIESFAKNRVTVIEAETGSGKTTEVPWALAQQRYRVHVSQPRRFAAKSVAEYMESKFGGIDGELIGYRHAHGEKCGPDAKVIFYTEGYLLKRLLHAKPGDFTEKDVFLFDESHEWTKYMEALYAVSKKHPELKLGIMSATLDTHAVSRYFGGDVGKIRVGGRHKKITELPAAAEISTDILLQVSQGRNVLVFLPGKSEIAMMQRKLESMGLNAEVLPLHSRLSAYDQDLVHRKFNRPKVVLATNIAQTSVTIPDMDVVVISGYERRLTVQDGMEVLAIVPITLPTYIQQSGRIGRTKDGYVINHGLPKGALQREDAWPIQNTLLEDLALRLIDGGEDPERLEFVHKPLPGAIEHAKQSLKRLKLIGSSGTPTFKGETVAKLPLEIRAGKMLVSAQTEISKLPSPEQRSKMMNAAILLAAISDSDELRAHVVRGSQPGQNKAFRRDGKTKDNRKQLDGWARLCEEVDTDRVRSDLIVEAYAFHKILTTPEQHRRKVGAAFGIDLGAFQAVHEKWLVLANRLGVRANTVDVRMLSSQEIRILLESIWFGWSDSAFEKVRSAEGARASYRPVSSGKGRVRNVSKHSAVAPSNLVVGSPFDLMTEVDGDPHESVVRILGRITHLDPNWLEINRFEGDKKAAHEVWKRVRKRDRSAAKNERDSGR